MKDERMTVLGQVAAGTVAPAEAERMLRDGPSGHAPPSRGGEVGPVYGEVGHLGLLPDHLVQFKIHGVSAGFIAALRDVGLDDLPPDKLVAARIHGVGPEYVQALRAVGLDEATIDDFIAMRIHGVGDTFVRTFTHEAQALGYPKVTPGQLVAASIHDLPPHQLAPLAAEMADAGLARPTLDQLIEYWAIGIDRTFVEEMRTLGFAAPTPGQVIRLKRVDMDADLLGLIRTVLRSQ